MLRLDGQVALVTGGGTGIGAAIAFVLAEEGVKIVLCGRRAEPLAEVADRLITDSLCLVCDVREASQVERTVARVVQQFGRLDILVNNAGIFQSVPFEETSTEQWDAIHDTNLRGAFLFSKAAWPHLKESKGQIVQVSSIAGSQGFSGCSAYCASKHGLNGLSEVLTIEGKPHGIRVLSVCPGSVDTPLWQALETDDVLERMMRVEDIAELCRYLVCSPRNIEHGKHIITNYQSPWG
ncbi:MAG: SDR family oxidoreductase [Armatimonadetes bacterium]|nr:SDR family oxidoreductase [Armatimonadota bacterium]